MELRVKCETLGESCSGGMVFIYFEIGGYAQEKEGKKN
jgi:hypothetical protein